MHIGHVILIVNILLVTIVLPVLLHKRWLRIRPQGNDILAGYQVYWLPRTQWNRSGLEEVLRVVDEFIPRALKPRVSFEIYPYGARLMPEPGTTGFLNDRHMPVAPPLSEESAAQVKKVVGTMRRVRPWIGADWRYIVMIMEGREGVTEIDVRLGRGINNKPVSHPKTWGIEHEIAQHLLSDASGHGLNRLHTNQNADALEKIMQERLDKILV